MPTMAFPRLTSAVFNHNLMHLQLWLLMSIATTSATPVITTPAQLVERDVNSVCGYWYGNDSTCMPYLRLHIYLNYLLLVVYAFDCNSYTPCVIAAYLTPNYVFCSPDGMQPITEVFEYEKGPVGGCGTGQLCWLVAIKR